MRTHHWLTAFLSGMVLLSAATQASAQYPPPGATGQANFSAVGYDGIPPGFNPYPTISPYDNVFEQTYNDDGTWMRNVNNRTDYKHRLSVDALFGIVRKGGGKMIGDPRSDTLMYFLGGDFAIDNNDAGESGGIDQEILDFNDGRGPWVPRFTDFLGAATGQGIGLTYEIESVDGQTLEFSGFGMFSATAYRELGSPLRTTGPVDDPLLRHTNSQRYVILGPGASFDDRFPFNPQGGPDDDIITYYIDLNNVSPWMPGLPLYDGTPDGTLVRTDHYYQTFLNTKAYGAGFTWAQTPYKDFGPFKVQTSVGARYIGVHEQFGFRAHDSGLDYSLITDPEEAFYGSVDEFESNPFILPTFMSLDSYTETHMGGPELGLRYATGGDSLHLVGETKFGVMGAHERLQVDAKGLGQPFIINAPAGFPPTTTAPDPNRNVFYDHEARSTRTYSSSFITPTFEQSFNTRSKFLSVIPVVKNLPFFREANFSAGYTILMVFQTSRPDSSVQWNANTGYDPTDPDLAGLAPEPIVDRRLWFLQTFNLGVEWEY